MTRRVHDLRVQVSPVQDVTVTQHLVHFSDRWRGNTEKCRLLFHAVIKRKVGTMHQYGSAGVSVEFLQATHMVYMGVRADDCFDDKAVPADKVHDAADFVAGIEHQRFARDRIADDGTIALQQTDRQ